MFCRNCGNELHDEAYVCVKCGQLVQDYQKSKKKKEQNPYSMMSVCGGPLVTFFLIAFAAGCLTLMLSIISIVAGDVTVLCSDYYGHKACSGYTTPFFTTAVTSLISGLACFGMGVAQFILGLKKGGLLKLLIIANFMFCTAMLIIGISTLVAVG